MKAFEQNVILFLFFFHCKRTSKNLFTCSKLQCFCELKGQISNGCPLHPHYSGIREPRDENKQTKTKPPLAVPTQHS